MVEEGYEKRQKNLCLSINAIIIYRNAYFRSKVGLMAITKSPAFEEEISNLQRRYSLHRRAIEYMDLLTSIIMNNEAIAHAADRYVEQRLNNKDEIVDNQSSRVVEDDFKNIMLEQGVGVDYGDINPLLIVLRESVTYSYGLNRRS